MAYGPFRLFFLFLLLNGFSLLLRVPFVGRPTRDTAEMNRRLLRTRFYFVTLRDERVRALLFQSRAKWYVMYQNVYRQIPFCRLGHWASHNDGVVCSSFFYI